MNWQTLDNLDNQEPTMCWLYLECLLASVIIKALLCLSPPASLSQVPPYGTCVGIV